MIKLPSFLQKRKPVPVVPVVPVVPAVPTKRLATEEEEVAAVKSYAGMNQMDYTAKLAEAKAEGHTTEVCSCDRVLPAFVHFVRCTCDNCPFRSKKDSRSLLDMLCETKKQE